MEIPGWVLFVIGLAVTLISYIVYAKDGSLLFFVFVGLGFILFGMGKMLLAKLKEKDEKEFSQNWQDYNKPTTLQQLPIGQAYYQQQYRQGSARPGNYSQPRQQISRQAAQPYQMHKSHSTPVSHQVHRQPTHAGQAMHLINCRHCGTRHAAHSNFCANCGQRLR